MWKQIIIFILISTSIFSQVEINFKYMNNIDYKLKNINEFKKGGTIPSEGYSDFLLIIKDFDENRSFLKLKLDNKKEELYMNFELELYEGLGSFLENKDVIYPMISIQKWDQNFPYKAYIQYKWFKVGRDKINWGPGKFGNLIISDFSKYYDHIGIDYNYKKLNFKYVLVSLNSYLTEDEFNELKVKYDENSDGIYEEKVKLFVAHRVEYQLTNEVKISLTEAEIIGGKVPEFNMINPLYIYHSSFTEGYSNVMGGLDLEYSKNKTKIYSSLVVDDWSGVGESDDYKPKAIGYLFGAEKKFNKYKINFEYARTSRWLYNRWTDYLKFTNRRIVTTSYGKSGRYVIDYPIGYYLGSDSEDYHFQIEHNKYLLGYQLIKKGDKNLRSDYSCVEKDKEWFELSGDVEKRHIFTLNYKIYEDCYVIGKYIKIENFENKKDENQDHFQFILGYDFN